MMQALTHPLPGTRLRWPTPIRRAARWVYRRRWARRLAIGAIVWHIVGAVMMMVAGPASAADDTNATGSITNVLGWMNVKDSHGIEAANLYLSIDDGGVSSPMKAIWSWLINIEFQAYRAAVMTAIWVIKLALSFDWLDLLLSPVREIGNAVTNLTGRADLSSFMLALAGAAVALWIFRGRFATGMYEFVVSLIIAVGAFGILSSPVEAIAGNDGMLTKTQTMSMEVANGLANNGQTSSGSSDEQVDKLTSQLVDTFIRQPTQLMTFGQVLDQKDKACAKAFDDAFLTKEDKSVGDRVRGAVTDIPVVGGILNDTLPGDSSEPNARVRNEVGKCPGGEDLKRYAENPGPEAAIAAAMLIPAGGLIFLYGVYLAGRCVLAAMWALTNAVKLIIVSVIGIAPMLRGPLLRALADVAMALMQVAFAIIFTVAYCLVITSLFKSDKTLMATVLLVDFAILMGIWLFRKGILGLGKWSDKLAALMARRPGASPVTVKPRGGSAGAADTMAKARAARGAYRGAKSIATRVASSKATQVAAGAATGGTSAALTKGVAAASTVKSAVDATKADKAPTPSSTPAPGSAPSPGPVDKDTAAPSPAPSTPAEKPVSMQSTHARSEALNDKLEQARSRDQHGNPVQSSPSAPPVVSGRASAPAAERPTRDDGRTTHERVQALADSNTTMRRSEQTAEQVRRTTPAATTGSSKGTRAQPPAADARRSGAPTAPSSVQT